MQFLHKGFTLRFLPQGNKQSGSFIQHLPEYPVASLRDEWLNRVFLRGVILRQEGAGFI